MIIPAGLDHQRALGGRWPIWLERLPKLADGILDEWQLRLDGSPKHGHTSLVLPVRNRDDAPAVLKLTFDGDDESAHESLALTHWAGHGAVRLLRADPGRRVLLLERLSDRDLRSVPASEACEIVAGLYPLLHRPALPKLVRLSRYVRRWLEALGELSRDAPIPRRLVEQALSNGHDLVANDLGTDSDHGAVIVHGDLHYENVLGAERAAWLAIDPKPMAGDRHYEPAPMLWNRWSEVVQAGDMRGEILRRLYTIVDAAGLEEQRTRDWVLVRLVLNAHWTIEAAQQANRPLTSAERDWITRCITIAKAVTR